MRRITKYILCLALTGGGVLPAAAAQTATGQTLSESTANAVREHVDEADDLTESLLRWQHIVTGVAKDEINLRKAPASTAITIDRADAQRLCDLVGALAAQVPQQAGGDAMTRGDLRSHVEKAQEIARELLPVNSMNTSGAANNMAANHTAAKTTAANNTAAGASGIVTIDRTSLERLDIELDAIDMLVPHMVKHTS